VKRSTHKLIVSTLYLCVWICFLISNLFSKPHDYIKDVAVFLWLMAGVMDIHKTYSDLNKKENKIYPAPLSTNVTLTV